LVTDGGVGERAAEVADETGKVCVERDGEETTARGDVGGALAEAAERRRRGGEDADVADDCEEACDATWSSRERPSRLSRWRW